METKVTTNGILENLRLNKTITGIFLVTGERGAGKTTWLKQLVAAARQVGYPVNGLLSPGAFENGNKIAINLVNLATDETRFMCTPVEPHLSAGRGRIRRLDTGKLVLGGWEMQEDVLQWGNELLYEAILSQHTAKSETPAILIIDELGPLELNYGLGFTNAIQLGDLLNLHAGIPEHFPTQEDQRLNQTKTIGQLASFIVVRPDLLPKAFVIWPQAQTIQIQKTSPGDPLSPRN